jgi:sodium/proline symporter
MVVATFLTTLLLFVLVGLLSLRHQKGSSVDYLLAGRSMPPSLVALSAVATNNSGYMFIGMIGYTYATGLSSIWMMVGWIVGDLVASLVVHRRVRELSEEHGLHTYSALLSHGKQGEERPLRIVIGLFTLIFLGTYAGAQLSAGSKALQVLFGWEAWSGAVIGAVIVLLYSFAGGIRASIWTDAAQSVVMVIAMVLMVLFGLEAIGGWGKMGEQLAAVGSGYHQLLPAIEGFSPATGFAGFLLGWFFAGYGVAGQPHIMIRFMTMADPGEIGRVRLYYYLWFTLFFGLTILAALCARLLLSDTASFDAALALPTLAMELLPPVR